MSIYYNPEVIRALTCERIRDARGTCIEGLTFDRPNGGAGLAERVRRLFARHSSPVA